MVTDRFNQNMSSIGTLMVLFLVLLVNQTTAEYDKKAQERFGVASLTRKSKELTKFSPFLEPYKGRQEQLLDKLPENFEVLFKSTISLETTVFCFALLYGIFHLRCWNPLSRKWLRNKHWAEDLEMVAIA